MNVRFSYGATADGITLDVIDGVKAEKLKTAGKSTVNRYLGLVRAIQGQANRRCYVFIYSHIGVWAAAALPARF